ncbi:MAG: hypothetical protein JWM11_6373 [Planctomycetaceae bacterium]|nr:hypothetical protein [Planctomycetaceae bacterium]
MASATEPWTCPLCERKFKIPVGTKLTACPDCQKKPTLRRSPAEARQGSDSENWYLPSENSKLSGPFTLQRLLEMYDDDELSMDDVVQQGLYGVPQSILVVSEQLSQQHKPARKTERIQAIPVVTTETIQLPNMELIRHMPMIFSRRVYGFNLLAEMLVNITDMVGGRSKRMEQAIEDIEKEVIDDLRRKARVAGATAVVGVRVQLGNLSGDKSLLIYGFAQGTPVFMKKIATADNDDDFQLTGPLDDD